MKTILRILFVLIITFVIVFPVGAQCWFNQLLDDVAKSSNTEFATFVRNNDNAFVAYEVIYNARGANAVMKTDPALLSKVSELLNDSEFLKRVGGQNGLEEIIRNNRLAPCKTCGNSGKTYLKPMDEYLQDVRYYANNYGNIPGANLVLRDLKTGADNTVDGTAFMLRIIEKNQNRFLGKITKFEGSIDDLTNGCRYDVYFKSGTKDIFGEFKSYSSMNNFLSSGGDTYKQFTTYWKSINSIDELHYYFNMNKIGDINTIKNRMKTVFQNNSELFNLMKPELKESLGISIRASNFSDNNLNEIVNTIIKLE